MKRRTAVIGSGPVAESHLSLLCRSNMFKPVVIFGRYSDRVSFLARKYNLEIANSLDDALSYHNVTMVDISTSNEQHYPYAIAALRSGKSVILEKPAAFTSCEVETLVSESKKRDLVILICFQKRFNRSLKCVQSYLKRGTSGTFLHGETRVFMPRKTSYYNSKWRSKIAFAGGGVLIYQAIHDLDLLCLLLGEVKSIRGEMRNTYHSTEVEDTVHLVMEFKSGGIHHFFASTDPRLPSQIETRLVFENGRLFFNDYGCSWSRHKEPSANRISWKGNTVMNRIKVRLCGLGSYKNILVDMEDKMLKKSDNLNSSLATAVEVHRVIEDFYNITRK